VYSEWFHPLIGGVLRVLEERCIRYADSIITVSDWIGNYLQKFNKEVKIIYNCPRLTDIPKFSVKEAREQLGLPTNAFIVSHIGTIRYGCRLDLLLQVAAQARNNNVHFIVVGDGPLGPQFRSAAREAHCPQLTVLPRTSRERALLHILASDLTWALYSDPSVSMNSRVGVPWKFFESLACGVPMLVEEGTLRAELVRKLNCGVILKSDEACDVSNAINSLADDPLYHHLMSNAAKSASSEFNWEAMSEKLVHVYRQLQNA